MTVAEARAQLEQNIATLVRVEKMEFGDFLRALAIASVGDAIDLLVEAAKREVIAAEQAGLAEAASLVSDPEAGGHA